MIFLAASKNGTLYYLIDKLVMCAWYQLYINIEFTDHLSETTTVVEMDLIMTRT